jgi:predicted nucleic-acid-binding protein
MSKRFLLDTNLILRHLVQDDLRQAKIAAKLFTASDRGDIVLVVLSTSSIAR